MWSRKLILAASLLVSITNVATPFVIGQALGLAYVAIWVSYKAAIQLVGSLVPNRVNALLYLSKYRRVDRQAIINRGYLTSLGVVVLQSALLVVASRFYPELKPFVGGLIVYIAAFQFAAVQNIIIRSLKRSEILIKVSIADMVLSAILLLVVILVPDFHLFILLSAVKEMLRGAFMHFLRPPLNKGEATRPVRLGVLSRYKYMHVSRGFLQVLSQLGDRVVYPIVFAIAAAGQAALGATVGMIIALLSSSAFTWALPRTMEGQDMSRWLVREWVRLFFLVAVIAAAMQLLIPAINSGVAYLTAKPLQLDSMFVAAFVFSSISSANFLSLGISKKRLTTNGYLFQHLAIISCAYAAMAGAQFLGVAAAASVYAGCSVSVLGVLVVNRKLVVNILGGSKSEYSV